MSASRRSSRSTRSCSSATTKGCCDDGDPGCSSSDPPGSGKGTQGVRIAEAFGIPAISTGDIFRANITNEHASSACRCKAIVDAGDYVPDS